MISIVIELNILTWMLRMYVIYCHGLGRARAELRDILELRTWANYPSGVFSANGRCHILYDTKSPSEEDQITG